MITVTLYTKKIHNTKNNTTFDKPFISYKGKRFEAVLSKDVRERLNKETIKYPMDIDLYDEDYFMKRVTYIRNDKTQGHKYQIAILGYSNPRAGHFEKRTLDMVVEEIDKSKPLEDDDMDEPIALEDKPLGQ